MNNNFNNTKKEITPTELENAGLNNDILNAAKNGDKKALIDSLSADDINKLNDILNDKQQLESILKSPMAAALLKAFGGKNG